MFQIAQKAYFCFSESLSYLVHFASHSFWVSGLIMEVLLSGALFIHHCVSSVLYLLGIIHHSVFIGLGCTFRVFFHILGLLYC